MQRACAKSTDLSRPHTLKPSHSCCLQVGEAAGVRDEALRAVDRLRARLRRAAGEAARAAVAAAQRPRVLVLRSLRPLRTVGWWLPDQVGAREGSAGSVAATRWLGA